MPEDIKKDLLTYFATANELLRHFWSSFPLSTPALIQKEAKVFKAISDLYDKIEAFRNGMPPDRRPLVGQLVVPIIQTLDKAIDKHSKVEKVNN